MLTLQSTHQLDLFANVTTHWLNTLGCIIVVVWGWEPRRVCILLASWCAKGGVLLPIIIKVHIVHESGPSISRRFVGLICGCETPTPSVGTLSSYYRIRWRFGTIISIMGGLGTHRSQHHSLSSAIAGFWFLLVFGFTLEYIPSRLPFDLDEGRRE